MHTRSDLVVTVAATANELIDAGELESRLGVDAAAAVRLAVRASARIRRALGFDPAYRTVRESFWGASGSALSLAGRPFASLVSVAPPGEDPLVVNEDFRIVRPGMESGDAYLFRSDTWASSGGGDEPVEGLDPDWEVTYRCGWWLPGMTGAPPSGAVPLPAELTEATFLLAQLQSAAGGLNPAVKSMSKAETRVEFRDVFSAALPAEVRGALAPYLPIGMA